MNTAWEVRLKVGGMLDMVDGGCDYLLEWVTSGPARAGNPICERGRP
jgi:hypothetical protein